MDLDILTIKQFYVDYYKDLPRFINLLTSLKLIPEEITCKTCKRKLQLNKETLYFRCQRKYRINGHIKVCKTQVSATKNTFFENSKITILQVVEFVVWWVFTRSPKFETFNRELGLARQTVVDWSNYCREVCINWSLERSTPLGGPGVYVELDVAKLGKWKFNKEQKLEGQWVFGGIERGTQKTFFVPVPDESKDTLIDVIKKYIMPGSIIISNIWKDYCLSDESFEQLKSSHSLEYVGPSNPLIDMQNIGRQWRNVKGNIPKFGKAPEHLVGYLAEYQFKSAYKGSQCLSQFLKETVKLYPGLK